MKVRIKGNVFYVYCVELTEFIFNKVNELLSINDNIQVEVIINN